MTLDPVKGRPHIGLAHGFVADCWLLVDISGSGCSSTPLVYASEFTNLMQDQIASVCI